MLGAGSVGLAAATLVLAFVHVTAAAAAALVVGGACWVVALSTLSSLYQLSLPQWVKARGMSFYLMVFQGGNAVGAAVLDIVPVGLQRTGELGLADDARTARRRMGACVHPRILTAWWRAAAWLACPPPSRCPVSGSA
jgi:hypothetical protein